MSDSLQQKKWREQKGNFRKRNRIVAVSFPNSEAQVLEGLAESYHQKLPIFIKSVVRSYLNNNGYVLPPDGQLERLERYLRSVANNINQLTRYIHGSSSLTYSNIQDLQQKLVEMSHEIERSLTLPPTIEAVLATMLDAHPEKLPTIIQYLQEINTNSGDH